MILEDVADIRTGLVTARKRANGKQDDYFKYKQLNLKAISDSGYININLTEEYKAEQKLKQDYFTQHGDILVRLSVPYTAVIINRKELCGYLVPSHFAIIRAKRDKIIPEYILWILRRKSTLQQIIRNNSGSTTLGTISSGFFSSIPIHSIPIEKQKAIGQLEILADREQELLQKLAEEKLKYRKSIISTAYVKCKGELR
jgi:restriction endonuclease S subunit